LTKAPRVNGKQLKRVLENAGFQCIAVEGSHHIMKRETPPARISVPIHGTATIKPKTYRRIVSLAGLTDDDVIKFM
jgi:predicted RNA binding protein YcfA (HicA-like mRNA interferase family)